MKRFEILKKMAMSATLLLTMVSCSSDDTSIVSSQKLSKVPLQVSVENGATSRGVVEGTTLPDNSTYRIYAYSKNSETKYEALNHLEGSAVRYKDGVSQIDDNPIYLPEDGSDVQVVALYGGIIGYYDQMQVHQVALSTKEQEDYLVGVNTNTVNKSNPSASLAFTHVMSRITLNIRKAADIDKYYKIPTITINNLAATAKLQTEGGHPYLTDVDATHNLSLPVKISDYLLETASDVITVDFLVLPIEQNGITIKLDGVEQEIKLPTTYFQMGQQYKFNLILTDSKVTVDCDEIFDTYARINVILDKGNTTSMIVPTGPNDYELKLYCGESKENMPLKQTVKAYNLDTFSFYMDDLHENTKYYYKIVYSVGNSICASSGISEFMTYKTADITKLGSLDISTFYTSESGRKTFSFSARKGSVLAFDCTVNQGNHSLKAQLSGAASESLFTMYSSSNDWRHKNVYYVLPKEGEYTLSLDYSVGKYGSIKVPAIKLIY